MEVARVNMIILMVMMAPKMMMETKMKMTTMMMMVMTTTLMIVIVVMTDQRWLAAKLPCIAAQWRVDKTPNPLNEGFRK